MKTKTKKRIGWMLLGIGLVMSVGSVLYGMYWAAGIQAALGCFGILAFVGMFAYGAYLVIDN